MPTDKPRVTFTISEEKLKELGSFQHENRIKNQTQAVLTLIEKGLSGYEVEAKKSPSTAEAAPGENRISLEDSNKLLVALGLIEEGQDLSDDDLAFLAHIVGLLDAWFSKRK